MIKNYFSLKLKINLKELYILVHFRTEARSKMEMYYYEMITVKFN